VFKVFFYVHILSIMAAFGPTFTFPMIAAQNQKDPKHAVFGSHLMDLIEYRYTIPFALLAGAAGIGMILSAHIHIFDNAWLWIAVILYVMAVIFALTVQGPNSKRMVSELGRLASAGPPPEGAPAGPPPLVAELGKKLQMGGIGLSVAVLVIMGLMIFKPGGAANLP
jgi:uncharacterized membrane protein